MIWHKSRRQTVNFHLFFLRFFLFALFRLAEVVLARVKREREKKEQLFPLWNYDKLTLGAWAIIQFERTNGYGMRSKWISTENRWFHKTFIILPDFNFVSLVLCVQFNWKEAFEREVEVRELWNTLSGRKKCVDRLLPEMSALEVWE